MHRSICFIYRQTLHSILLATARQWFIVLLIADHDIHKLISFVKIDELGTAKIGISSVEWCAFVNVNIVTGKRSSCLRRELMLQLMRLALRLVGG